MAQMWEQFRKKNFFVGDLQWDEVICDVLKTMDVYILMYFQWFLEVLAKMIKIAETAI